MVVVTYNHSNMTTTVMAAPAIQTSFGDISFAGGMTYDYRNDIIYMTGQVGADRLFHWCCQDDAGQH